MVLKICAGKLKLKGHGDIWQMDFDFLCVGPHTHTWQTEFSLADSVDFSSVLAHTVNWQTALPEIATAIVMLSLVYEWMFNRLVLNSNGTNDGRAKSPDGCSIDFGPDVCWNGCSIVFGPDVCCNRC